MSELAHDAHGDLERGGPGAVSGDTVDDGLDRPGPTFWISMAIGAGLVVFGLRNLVAEQREALRSIGTWAAGGALALDLLLVPIGAAIGWAAKRVVPTVAWPPVRAALLASAVLIAFALPLVTHQGGKPDNPSLRPRDYGSGLTWSLVIVWLIAGALATVAVVRYRAAQPSPD